MTTDDDRVLTFTDWCQLNSFSLSTGQRLIASGQGPVFVQLSARRKGVTVAENRRWQKSRVIETREGVFVERVQCDLFSLTYDFTSRHGVLHMQEFNCCDMTGCIELFYGIDPDVQYISTMAADQPDTGYFRKEGNWEATVPARKRGGAQ